MKKFSPSPLLVSALSIAFFAMPAVCAAQISLQKPNFGVQRKASSTPEVSLAGTFGSQSSPVSSNSSQTVAFNLKNFDDSKGIKVQAGPPCHADASPQSAGGGVYKVTLTFDTVSSTDTCSIDFQSVANNTTLNARVWVAATQTDPGVAVFEHANSISIHTNTGQTIQAAVSTRQMPPGANMAMLIMSTSQGMVMVTVIAPNVIQVSLNGCVLQGKITGASADAKAMAAVPSCNGITSATVQAK